jgi:hypothetical protein
MTITKKEFEKLVKQSGLSIVKRFMHEYLDDELIKHPDCKAITLTLEGFIKYIEENYHD